MQASNDWVELAVRENDELVVALFWRPCDDATGISTVDSRRGETAFALVPGDCALDAFRHPFSYLRALEPADEPEAAAVDVDELWLWELAEATIAELADLLARQPDAGC